MSNSRSLESATPGADLVGRKLLGVESRPKRMEIIWKAILCRLPKDSEEPLFANTQDDLIWALLNSNEFKFVR